MPFIGLERILYPECSIYQLMDLKRQCQQLLNSMKMKKYISKSVQLYTSVKFLPVISLDVIKSKGI